jgi:general stress protein CsbA
MYNLCRVLKTVITAVLIVMSILDPHMLNWWVGWITVVKLWFGGWLWL